MAAALRVETTRAIFPRPALETAATPRLEYAASTTIVARAPLLTIGSSRVSIARKTRIDRPVVHRRLCHGWVPPKYHIQRRRHRLGDAHRQPGRLHHLHRHVGLDQVDP